jgi:hypothetical protein
MPGSGPPYIPTPPPYPYAYPPPRTGNAKATTALIAGIASIVLCWLLIVDLIPVILAITFGAIGRSQAVRTSDHHSKSTATAGLVCGVIGAVFALVLTIIVYSRLRPCLNDPIGSSAYQHCVSQRL